VLRWVGGSPESVGQRGEAAAGRQFAPHLPQQERVSPGLIAQHRRGSAGSSGGDVRLTRQVVGDLLGGQSVQVEPPNTVQPVQLGDGTDQVGGSVRWRGSLRGQHQDAGVLGLRDQELEELQSGLACPMQILEHQHQGADPGGGQERVGAGPEQLRGVLALR